MTQRNDSSTWITLSKKGWEPSENRGFNQQATEPVAFRMNVKNENLLGGLPFRQGKYGSRLRLRKCKDVTYRATTKKRKSV